MGVYDRSRETALRLLTKRGGTIQILEFAANAPADTSKPWRGSGNPPIAHSGKGIVVDEDDGRTMIVAAKGLTVVPTEDMQAVDAVGDVWGIENVKEVNPNGLEPIVYRLRLKE